MNTEWKNPLLKLEPLTQEEYALLPNEIGGDIQKREGAILWDEGGGPHGCWFICESDLEWSPQGSCPDDIWRSKCNYFYGYLDQWRKERQNREGEHPELGNLDPKQQASTTKPPLQLLPPAAMQEIAHVLKLGADKYGVYNWRGNTDSIQDSTYYGAILRHVTAMMNGEALDPESQRSHWAHIGATAMIMLDVLNEREKATQSEPQVGTRWTRYGNTYLLCCLMSTQFALINISDGTSFTDRWHESELEAFGGSFDQFTQVTEGES